MHPLEAYYRLPRDHRWLDNPYNVGGRATDVGQLGQALMVALRDAYPINHVPADLAERCQELGAVLNVAERLIEEFIELVSIDQLPPPA